MGGSGESQCSLRFPLFAAAVSQRLAALAAALMAVAAPSGGGGGGVGAGGAAAPRQLAATCRALCGRLKLAALLPQ